MTCASTRSATPSPSGRRRRPRPASGRVAPRQRAGRRPLRRDRRRRRRRRAGAAAPGRDADHHHPLRIVASPARRARASGGRASAAAVAAGLADRDLRPPHDRRRRRHLADAMRSVGIRPDALARRVAPATNGRRSSSCTSSRARCSRPRASPIGLVDMVSGSTRFELRRGPGVALRGTPDVPARRCAVPRPRSASSRPTGRPGAPQPRHPDDGRAARGPPDSITTIPGPGASPSTSATSIATASAARRRNRRARRGPCRPARRDRQRS